MSELERIGTTGLHKIEKRKGGRQPGTPKTGGRQKGSGNKRSTQLLQSLLAHDCLPGKEIAELMQSPRLQPYEKMECWFKLLPYLYPQFATVQSEDYLGVEQVAGMLGAQASKFKAALEGEVQDPMAVARVLEKVRKIA